MNNRESRMLSLLLLFPVTCIGVVRGVCIDDDLSSCPPPFPDFSVIFRGTLNLIPDIKLSLQNVTHQSDNCPMAVNWTDFNSRLNDGYPVQLNPICLLTTTTTTTTTTTKTTTTTVYPSITRTSSAAAKPSTYQRISSDQQSTKGATVVQFDSSSSTVPSTEEFVSIPTESPTSPGAPVPPNAVASTDSKDKTTIGLAVGITAGVLVVGTVAVAVFAAIRCRREKNAAVLQRAISTQSKAPLVTDDSFQPVTPGPTFPENPLSAYNGPQSPTIRETITLRDSTFQESSTDATLPRLHRRRAEHDCTPEQQQQVVAKENVVLYGRDNVAVEIGNEEEEEEEEEQDDAGYAGSEVGQELWENEMNALFDAAKLESSEDIDETASRQQLSVVVKDAGGSGSTRYDDDESSSSSSPSSSSQYIVPAVKDRSRDLFGSSSVKKLSALKLNLPSPAKPSQSVEATPVTALGSPFLVPSSAKPLITPRNPSGARHPLSQTLFSGQNSTKTSKAKAASKVRFETNSPPAYSSPPPPPPPPPAFARGSSGLRREDQDHVQFEVPIDVPNELPSYSEVVLTLGVDDQPSFDATSSSPAPDQSSSSSSSQAETTTPRTGAIDPPQKSSVDSSQERPTNTAIIRPWTAPTGAPAAEAVGLNAAAAAGQESTDRVDSDHTNSTGEGQGVSSRPSDPSPSSRPVRSLLSQFESAARKTTK